MPEDLVTLVNNTMTFLGWFMLPFATILVIEWLVRIFRSLFGDD